MGISGWLLSLALVLTVNGAQATEVDAGPFKYTFDTSECSLNRDTGAVKVIAYAKKYPNEKLEADVTLGKILNAKFVDKYSVEWELNPALDRRAGCTHELKNVVFKDEKLISFDVSLACTGLYDRKNVGAVFELKTVGNDTIHCEL